MKKKPPHEVIRGFNDPTTIFLKKIRWFQDQYSDLHPRYPRASFSFIGHSNGTYMLAHSLKRIPGMAFDRVALVGSVLPREYDWNKLFTLGRRFNPRSTRSV